MPCFVVVFVVCLFVLMCVACLFFGVFGGFVDGVGLNLVCAMLFGVVIISLVLWFNHAGDVCFPLFFSKNVLRVMLTLFVL